MNVRFFGGRKDEYVSIPRHNPIGLYFCADTRELFLGDRLLSDGLRVVPTFADLPSISEYKAAEGVIYFVAETKNGYVLPRGGSDWLQVIYAPAADEGAEVDLSGYYTKAEVDEAILEAIANINIEVDLTGLATEAYVDEKVSAIESLEVPTKVSELENDVGYLTEHQDLSEYAKKSDIPTDYLKAIPEEYVTESELAEELAKIEHPVVDLKGYATEDYVNEAVGSIQVPDVSNFITMEDVEAKGYITEVPAEYITESELDDKGYLTEHQDLSEYAKRNELPSVAGLASEEFVAEAIAAIEFPEADLTDYARKADLEVKFFCFRAQCFFLPNL